MFKKDNLLKLQNILKEKKLDAYLIYTSDPHNSEYVSEHFLSLRKYFCPFSGSAGQVLVLQDEAYLFADGRYWIQAEKELQDSSINLIRLGDLHAPTLISLLKKKNIKKVATDFSLMTESQKEAIENKGISLFNLDVTNLIEDRPSLSEDKVFELDSTLVTLSTKIKLHNILTQVAEVGAEANLVTTLDDIAWILSLRGNDVLHNPVFYSYLYISKDFGTHLFINPSKVEGINLDEIIIHPYEEISSFLEEHKKVKTLVDPTRANAYLYSILKSKINGRNPSYLMKAIKGPIEIVNTIKVQEIDGLALVKFKKYLKENLSKNLTEYDYSEVLQGFRFENKLCYDLSFGTIAAVGANAAQMHYAPTKEKSSIVSSDEIELLVDSGGQYFGGTTDTTRTFLVGEATKEFKRDYALTLKALINLSKTIFLKGSDGHTIDIRARSFMWENGLDYKCGTGHGVGYMLNVHEGPNGFRYKKVSGIDDHDEIVPGMITTVEPGVYKANKYGIRIENNLLCVKAFETSDGEFYKFQTITYVPIDKEALDLSIMTKEEIDWLNTYHKEVYERLSKLTKDEELLEFLKQETSEITL